MVSMPPAATLEITGVRAEVTFFKQLLDKLDVDAEILQVGDFKAAGEPLTLLPACSPAVAAAIRAIRGRPL